jgi:asparagine synthase (glutamine-hydrolysing)
MCGIAAMFSRRHPISLDALSSATAQLAHRGPDGQAMWTSPDQRVGLGHTRLSIIDLATGAQPIRNESGRIRAVVNGEFYDYERITRSLEERGHRFTTRTDSEILVHLYEEIGTACLVHLRGEFAFVLHDQDNDIIFAARDRFGVKPLFYAMVGETLCLASEIKALLAGGMVADWDREAFFQQLFIGLDEDRTLFRNIFQVPPGHILVASRYGTRICEYWDLKYPRLDETADAASDEEHIERLHAALTEAVQLRLRADVPVGYFLSGGLDSSTVYGIAAANSSAPARAFTVAFNDDPEYNEADIARETVQRAGGVFHSIPVSQADISDNFPDAVWHAEMLGLNAHGVARFIQAKAVSQAGFKVVMSGAGSDDILAGYPSAKHDYLQTRSLGHYALDGLSERGTTKLLSSVHNVLGFVPSWMKKILLNRSIFFALLADDFAEEFAVRDPYRMFLNRFDVPGRLAGCDPVLQSLYLWTKVFLGSYELCAERLEMAHAVEVRTPFLDHHLVEVVRRIPVELLIRNMKEKFVLRQAGRPYITDTVYDRRKHSFSAPPISDSGNRKMHDLVQDVLRGPDLVALPFFDRDAVVALLDRIPTLSYANRVGLDSAIMLIFCACILQRRYKM